jgi:hypothetical protein
MSYMRGNFYLWRDGERLHLWAADGYDGWDDSIWAETLRVDCKTTDERASGVALPMDIVDELVAMRLAEMIDEKRFADAIDRAVARSFGNGGCLSLAAKAADLKAALKNAVRKPEAE